MLYRFGRFLSRLLFTLTGRLESIGSESIPEAGGVIVCSNHISHLDPPAVGAGMSRQVHFMAKEELFRVPVLGELIRRVGAFPVRRGTADRRALKRAIELLNEGHVVGLFPEGTRSTDGKLRSPEPGVGLIVLKSGAPVVPAAVSGTNRVLPSGSSRLRRHRCRVAYGSPMRFDDLAGSCDRSAVEEVGRRIMSAIAELQSPQGS
ncbi:MAG: 1-acyl-sn-glycerol-3-phosphate acyltransferase [Armatimonadetes bacterium]|nr:1-acyl-sn-glycerol-3-phosphate acyltransferase [Armatimonadota bacterium]